MDNRLTLRIKIKPYLAAFITHIHGKGKPPPVYIPKKSPIAQFLNHMLCKRPLNAREEVLTDENSLEMILPFFEWRSPLVYNYMTEKTELALEEMITDIFWVTYTKFANAKFLAGIPVNIVPHLFITQYELPDDPALENNLRKYIYRKQNKNVKAPIRNYKVDKS